MAEAHKIKARPVPPMNVDASQPAADAAQTNTGAGTVVTNSTIVDPALDPDASDPASVVNAAHQQSVASSSGPLVMSPTGTVAPNASSVNPVQQSSSTNTTPSAGAGGGSASYQQLQSFYNNSYVSSQYATQKSSFDSLARVSKPSEPVVEWSDNEAGGPIFSLKASKMEYNRNLFPNDTYKQAAQRFFKKIEADLRYTFKDAQEFSMRLREYKDYPDREFVITRDAQIRHNYDTDTWHWWFLDELSLLVKRMKVK
jgi:hypothetical protein